MLAWSMLLLAGAIFFSAWFYWAQFSANVAHWLADTNSIAEAGQWGDSFGGFNALMGALGFCGIVATLLVQTTALGRQQRDLHVQRFEQSFFELLRLLREARNEARFKFSSTVQLNRGISVGKVVEGHSAFRQGSYEVRYWIEKLENKRGKPLDRFTLGRLYARRVHTPFESTWGVYYRLVHSTLDRIDVDPVLRRGEKIRYANILRGQLTSFEATMAGLNALAPFADDFQYLIVKYRLLKCVRSHSFLGRILKRYYPKKTFLGRRRFMGLVW